MRKLSIWKSRSLRSKRFRVVWEQRTRNESQRLREKMALVPFLARPKPKIMLPGLCLLRNPKQTLATQATCLVSDVIAHFRLFATNHNLIAGRFLPWVPEAFHARFPVFSRLRSSCLRPLAEHVSACGRRNKPSRCTREKTSGTQGSRFYVLPKIRNRTGKPVSSS